MSSKFRRVITINSVLLGLTVILVVIPLLVLGQESIISAPAEPTPWWKRVDEIQAILLRWVTALSIVAVAAIAAAGHILSKLKELRERMEQDAEELRKRMDREEARRIEATKAAVLVVSNKELHQAIKESAITDDSIETIGKKLQDRAANHD